MSASPNESRSDAEIPNGPGGAAILAAGIGCGSFGILAFLGDASERIGRALNFYNPTGTLSGVSTVAIMIWLAMWLVLNRLWHERQIELIKVNTAAFALLGIGFLLTFPPVMDLLQGK